MPSQLNKPGVSTTSHAEEESKKQLDHEIRNMITTLTNRLTQLHSISKFRPTPHGDGNDDDDRGLRIVTLAGTNEGATMRSGFDEKVAMSEEQDMLGAYINSNFQAVNNSILLGGSYKVEDPGVHMMIEEYRGKEKKKKDKGGPKNSKESQKKSHEME
ncbi:uncharacterized protein [Aristolochia californica]|uniref:uncharacterized protein n=1 Tax=Aristolochia californica TaxID=171875 RepID=UPI0035D6EFCD